MTVALPTGSPTWSADTWRTRWPGHWPSTPSWSSPAGRPTPLDALDFTVLGPGERLAQVELKAKHQTTAAWERWSPSC